MTVACGNPVHNLVWRIVWTDAAETESELIAAFRYAEDAAIAVAGHNGQIVVYAPTGKLVWTEVRMTQSAAESYDYAAEVMYKTAGLIPVDKKF